MRRAGYYPVVFSPNGSFSNDPMKKNIDELTWKSVVTHCQNVEQTNHGSMETKNTDKINE